DGGEVLDGMEAEADEVAKAADAPAVPGGADRMRRILDDAQAVAPGDGIEPVHVDREPRKMHRHDRAGARRDRRLDLIEVDIAAIEIDIDEHRMRAHAHDDIRGGDEAHRRRDDLIARPDAGREQRMLEARGRGSLRAYRAPA